MLQADRERACTKQAFVTLKPPSMSGKAFWEQVQTTGTFDGESATSEDKLPSERGTNPIFNTRTLFASRART